MNNKIPYVDQALARELIKDESEALSALVCSLSQAARQGHLCLSIKGEAISPTIQELWEEFSPAEQAQMEGLVKQGSKLSHPLIMRQDSNLYFPKYYDMELLLLKKVRELLNHASSFDIDPEMVETLLAQQPVLQEQALAIKTALQSPLALICGGPGTGKTYTAGVLIKLLLEIKPDCQVGLIAPTGKAAANLQKSIQGFSSQTIHAHLQGKKEPLAYDLLLVDESSMIDTKLMLRLLLSVKPGCRLVFLGDPYQLPPVEVGAPFADFVQTLPSVVLKKCVRTDLQEIVALAEAIRCGRSEEVIDLLSAKTKAIRWSENFNEEDIVPNTRFLTPMRKGPFGVEKINQRLHQKSENSQIPIMIAKNDYRLQLFNGEVGYIEGDFAYFSQDRKIKTSLLPKYDFAYCLSVHKSQGSEFDNVAILLPKGSVVFGREVFYTAVTRAKKSLHIFADQETLLATLKKNSFRQSGFSEMWMQHAHKQGFEEFEI